MQRGGDCVDDLVNVLKDFSNPRSKVLIFTNKTVKVYQHNSESDSQFLLYFSSRPSIHYAIDI